MSKQMAFKQDWNAPGLYHDVLAATMEHLAVSRQDILQIAEKAKSMGGWEFSSSGL